MPERLLCIKKEPIIFNSPSEKEPTETPGVLKNVTILSRVGAEYLIEIPKGPHIPNVGKNIPVVTSVTNLSSLPSEKEIEKKNVPVEKEDVVRLIIPKADADVLVPLIKTLSSSEAEKYR